MTHPTAQAPDQPLWAITSYFNPMGSARRRANYRAFRRHLGVPLATIEWAQHGAFELRSDDADLLVQVQGGSLLWQKERLLNLLLPRLPAHCRYVAWLDCDIVFERDDWAPAAVDALQTARVVQLYQQARILQRTALDQVPHIDHWGQVPAPLTLTGVMAAIPARADLARWGQAQIEPTVTATRPSPGFAWAAQRQLLAEHPLLDVWVVGGGDAANCFAALGIPEPVAQRHGLGAAHRAHYLARAHALAAAVDGRVAHLPGTLHTLWHGDLDDRHYRDRHRLLVDHGFDPGRFLEPADSGVWQWTSAAGALPEVVRNYFRQRHEDGNPRDAASGP